MTLPIVVSASALLFTIASFWWIQVRRGRLVCSSPLTYAGYFGDDQLILVLPLVMYNTGPAPIVVLDFRLWLGSASRESPLHLRWRAMQPGISPAGVGEGRVFPSPIPIGGRQAVERFIELGCKPSDLKPSSGPYSATVEIRAAHTRTWLKLVSFDLNTQISTEDSRRFLVRPNDPEWEES